MKSKTWYFNFSAVKKDLRRFSPAWLLYGIALVLIQLGLLADTGGSLDAAEYLGNSLMPLILLNALYGFACAQLLFGDLFQSRLCYALHAMPLRREGWFLVHTLSGLLMSLVPNLLAMVLSLPVLGSYGSAAPLWLLGMTLQFVFFFGLGIFCTMCTGNRFAMALFYGIFNFLSLIVYWMASSLYEPRMPGIAIPEEPFLRLCPALHYAAGNFEPIQYGPACVPALRFVEGGWRYLTVLFGIGLALTGLALLLYRKRKLECAGDFLAFRGIAPVFRILYTLCVGMVFYGFQQIFFDDGQNWLPTLFLALGIAVGFFTAQMLLGRTPRVFRPGNFLRCGTLLVVLLASLWVTDLDPLGIVRYVPEPEAVASARISGSRYDADHGYFTENPEEIADFAAIHHQILQIGDFPEGFRCDVTLHYTLKSGREVERHYELSTESPQARMVNGYLSRPEFVLGYTDWEEYLSSVYLITTDNEVDGSMESLHLTNPRDIRGLLEAVRADCQAGLITNPTDYLYQTKDYAFWLYIQSTQDQRCVSIPVGNSCTETLSWLTAAGGR